MSNPFIGVRIKHALVLKPARYTFVTGVLRLSCNGTKCQKYAQILRQPNLGIELDWQARNPKLGLTYRSRGGREWQHFVENDRLN